MEIHNYGCYEIFAEVFGIPYTSDEIIKKIGNRWEQKDIIKILINDFFAVEVAKPTEKYDIILTGKHIGLYDGKNKMKHYLKCRKVSTDINRVQIDKVFRICHKQ